MTKFDTLKEFESFYQMFHPAVQNTDQGFLWFSGVPHPLFNAIMHLSCPRSPAKIIETVLQQTPQDIPVSFWSHAYNDVADLIPILKKNNFQHLITCMLMTWKVKDFRHSPADIRKGNPASFYNILAHVFQFDDNVTIPYAKLMEKTKNLENFEICFEDQAIGIGTLMRNGNLGAIFNIATLVDYQKRGFGKAMMQFLMQRARQQGIEKLILLSSPIAEKLYADLGFENCFPIDLYARQ